MFLAQSIDVIFLDIAVYIALCAVFDQLEASQDVISLMCPEDFHLPSVADWQIQYWNYTEVVKQPGETNAVDAK